MDKFTFTETEIKGVYVIDPTVYGDHRGSFMETYNENAFKRAGINCTFVQDNQSSSMKGVLRGLHFQKNYPQAKLVRVLKGQVFDVAVDLRKGSSTYGTWVGIVLSEKNKKQFFVPRGFAHGFVVMSDYAEFTYKCDDFYHPEDEGGIIYNDSDLAINWPIVGDVRLSDKDKEFPTIAQSKIELEGDSL